MQRGTVDLGFGLLVEGYVNLPSSSVIGTHIIMGCRMSLLAPSNAGTVVTEEIMSSLHSCRISMSSETISLFPMRMRGGDRCSSKITYGRPTGNSQQ